MGIYPDTAPQIWIDENTLLGKEQASYHWQYLVLSQIAVLFVGFSCSVYAAADSSLLFPMVCMTVALSLAVGIWLFHGRVMVYENGLKIRAFLGSQVCLWTSITQLFDNCDAYGHATSIRITHRNGYAIRVPDNVTDFNTLGQTIIRRFIDVNLDDSLQLVRNGDALYFGHVALHATHIEVDANRLPLSRIETFHLEHFGRIQLHVWADDTKKRWLSLSDFPVPNRHLLKKIVLTLRADNQQQSTPEIPPPSPESKESDPDVFTFE
jgi:hypothetical protein